MNWKNKNVSLTGAGGFIGSHLAERLVYLGANVKAFVRYNSRNDCGQLENLPDNILSQITVIAGDLRDPNAVRDLVADTDIIFHLGSLIAIPYSYVHPMEVIDTNVLGTTNILMAAKDNHVEKIIHTSTSEVYGTARYVPIDEKHPLQGQSPYSASKIGADMIAYSFYTSFKLPVAIIRPFNTYGPRQSARAVTPTIITQALTKKVIRLGSLHPTRDLTFVTDTIEGFIKIAEKEKSIGEVINIGSGFEISVGDLAEKILKLSQSKVKIEIDKKRVRPEYSEVERLCADFTKARKILGWQPQVSLDDGLKRTIKWISDHIEEYKVGMYTI
ncbi:MAG: GDP-mannose 4,6-dehydratase [Actinobacteria bacterium]|nr:GDP-mannose 4,6-dehydratase [Actinomycetota bacterium]